MRRSTELGVANRVLNRLYLDQAPLLKSCQISGLPNWTIFRMGLRRSRRTYTVITPEQHHWPVSFLADAPDRQHD